MIINPRMLQLQEARGILAEVLRIDISEVEDMIRIRMEERERDWLHVEETELWPEMLWV